MKWRPIKTAPRDGTYIIGRHPEYADGLVMFWDDDEWVARDLELVLNSNIYTPDPIEWRPFTEPPK